MDVSLSGLVERFGLEKSQTKPKKSLTCGMRIDNLEKFAKTSLVAEVILDRPRQE
jgi:hypothetical protein